MLLVNLTATCYASATYSPADDKISIEIADKSYEIPLSVVQFLFAHV